MGALNPAANVIIQCVGCGLKLQRISGSVGRVRVCERRNGKLITTYVFKCPTCGDEMKPVEPKEKK